MNIVDLHVHSTKSDGSYTPSELVEYAITKGLSAFALTDHDTVAGLPEAFARAEHELIEVIPGIEFSTEYEGRDIHILGLFIRYETPSFLKQLTAFQNSRLIRNEKMCTLLQKAGIDITFEKLQQHFPGAVVTRAHYAKYLLAGGYIKSIPEAFERYIGDRSPCFVPREKVSPQQAVELILDAGGIPILAHPVLYHMGRDRLELLVSRLTTVGLLGIEAIYSTYSSAEERDMRSIAKKFGLLISGGSDFHGTTKPGLDLAVGYGNLVVPEDILLRLKEKSIRPL